MKVNMTTLIRIGNSQGIRIPKAVIEQARLEDKQLELKVTDDGVLIHPVKKNREGWKELFDKTKKTLEASEAEKQWLEAPLSDDEDWEW